MEINNIFPIKDYSKINIYQTWNDFNKSKILELTDKFYPYIHYNNFHFTSKLNYKDELHRCYNRMKKLFPKDFNFMQETYILPDDKEIIEKKFKDYKISKNNLWLIKPGVGSLGNGIKILTNFSDLYDRGVITKYIHNPLLLNGKKFDLRLYVLITSFLPLKIYLNKEGLVRITTKYYTLDENNYNNSFIHLTNTGVNQKNKNYIFSKNVTDENSNKWSLATLKNYLKRNGINYKKIFYKIKDIIIKSLLSSEYIFTKESRKKYFGKKVSTIIGYDILIDENLKPCLLEMNCICPDLLPHDIVDEVIKPEVIKNYLNIIGLVPFSHKSNKPLDDVYEYKDKIEEVVDDSLCEFERADGSFERIFPLKDNVYYYKKVFESPGKENELLWEKLKDFV